MSRGRLSLNVICNSLAVRTGEDAVTLAFANRRRRRLAKSAPLPSSPRLRGEGAGRRMRGGANGQSEMPPVSHQSWLPCLSWYRPWSGSSRADAALGSKRTKSAEPPKAGSKKEPRYARIDRFTRNSHRLSPFSGTYRALGNVVSQAARICLTIAMLCCASEAGSAHAKLHSFVFSNALNVEWNGSAIPSAWISNPSRVYLSPSTPAIW
jgi:hypothetical protein